MGRLGPFPSSTPRLFIKKFYKFLQGSGFLRDQENSESEANFLNGGWPSVLYTQVKETLPFSEHGRQNAHSASATQLHGHTIRYSNVYRPPPPFIINAIGVYICISNGMTVQLCGRSAVCILAAGAR